MKKPPPVEAHWLDWTPETPEDVDDGAGRIMRCYPDDLVWTRRLGLLYRLRLALLSGCLRNDLSFRYIIDNCVITRQ